MSLYNKTAKGIKWSFIGTISNLVIQVTMGVVLARLLLPSEFGLYGMSFAILAISRSVIDSGLYQSLIQKKEADRIDFSVVFHFNLFLSIIISLALFIFSQVIEDFYGHAGVSTIIRYLSLIVLIESFSIVQKATLIKDIRFNTITKIETVSRLVSGGSSIIMAYSGFGIWSLLAKDLIFSLLSTALYWYINPVRILIKVPYKRIIPLFNFGFKIFIADQIENLSNQVARVIIGKKFTTKNLGLFVKADELQQMFSQVSVVSLNKVMFPSFVQIQDDNIKLKLKYEVLMETTMLLLIPILFSAVLLGDEIILILIGENWSASIPYFKLLCISGIFYPISVYNLNILKVKGEGSLYLKTCLISKGLLIPFLLIGFQFGVIGLIYALLAQRFVAAIINSYHSGRLIGYSTLNQAKGIGISFIVAIVPFLILQIIKHLYFKDFSIYLGALFFGLTYLLIYLALSLIFQKQKLQPLVDLFKGTSTKKNSH